MYWSHRHRVQNQSVDDARRRRASLQDRERVSRRTGLVAEVLEVRQLLAMSTVTVVPSISSPVYGDSLHFTAAVSGSAPGGPTPTGAVQFSLDGSPVGPAFPLSGGATITPDITLPVGVH